MKKIAVIGCKGMAGHVVKTYLESTGNYDVWGIARGIQSGENLINLDVSNTKELEGIFNKGNFDVVVNCIGLLNKTAEDNPELTYNMIKEILLSKQELLFNEVSDYEFDK